MALAAQVLAREMCSMSCDEILEEIVELAVKPSPAEKISSADLDNAIKHEIAEKGDLSRFVRHDETEEYEISKFGDEVDSAAFSEANAQSRYIVMRERGETPESIRAAANVKEEQALIELCDDIIAGARKEPEAPPPKPSDDLSADVIIRLFHRMEEARVSKIRDQFLEARLGQIFELAHEAHTQKDSLMETARNIVRLHRERSAG